MANDAANPILSGDVNSALIDSTVNFLRNKLLITFKRKTAFNDMTREMGRRFKFSGDKLHQFNVSGGEVPVVRVEEYGRFASNKAQADYPCIVQPVMAVTNTMYSLHSLLYSKGPNTKIKLRKKEMMKMVETIVNFEAREEYSDGTEREQLIGNNAVFLKSNTGRITYGLATADNPEHDNQRFPVTAANWDYDNIAGALDNAVTGIQNKGGMVDGIIMTRDAWLQLIKGYRGKLELTDKQTVKEGRSRIYYNESIPMDWDQNDNFEADDQKVLVAQFKDNFSHKIHRDAMWAPKRVNADPNVLAEIDQLYAMRLMYYELLNRLALVFGQ